MYGIYIVYIIESNTENLVDIKVCVWYVYGICMVYVYTNESNTESLLDIKICV